MIVTIAQVTDLDRFLEVFSGIGATKRLEHGCKGARVFVDPEHPGRVWSIFDWEPEDYARFLADPAIPAIARQLGLKSAPVQVFASAECDS